MALDLQTKRTTVTVTDFKFLEQCYGINYSDHGLLFDDHCRRVSNLQETMFWDWMHCIVASGGIGQYEVNQFVLKIVQSGVTLENLDTFVQQIKVPGSACKLDKRFFYETYC
jgi:hypothetical protein